MTLPLRADERPHILDSSLDLDHLEDNKPTCTPPPETASERGLLGAAAQSCSHESDQQNSTAAESLFAVVDASQSATNSLYAERQPSGSKTTAGQTSGSETTAGQANVGHDPRHMATNIELDSQRSYQRPQSPTARRAQEEAEVRAWRGLVSDPYTLLVQLFSAALELMGHSDPGAAGNAGDTSGTSSAVVTLLQVKLWQSDQQTPQCFASGIQVL